MWLVVLAAGSWGGPHGPSVTHAPHPRSACCAASGPLGGTRLSPFSGHRRHPTCVCTASALGRTRPSPYSGHRRHLTCAYGSLFTLMAVQSVTAQALPLALTEVMATPDAVAETVASVSAASAAVEFALLPVTAALTDSVGRKPLLLMLPLAATALRLLVVWRPVLWTIMLSRAVVGLLVSYHFIFVQVASADLFKGDSAALASLEGKAAACWGAAYAVGMLVGGAALSRHGARFTFALSGGLALLAALLGLGTEETLRREERVPFSVARPHPLGFFRLFAPAPGHSRSRAPAVAEASAEAMPADAGRRAQREARRSGGGGGGSAPPQRTIRVLACILALHALHDGEGDVWQVFSAERHGWSTGLIGAYGAACGVASMLGGLLTGVSVRRLGNRAHTVMWTISTVRASPHGTAVASPSVAHALRSTPPSPLHPCTPPLSSIHLDARRSPAATAQAISNLLFATRSSLLAFSSVGFTAAEDCMSAAVTARICAAGDAAGLRQGRLAADVQNLLAFARVAGLYSFGKLYSIGAKSQLPQLPYLLCAAAQIAAAALALFAMPASDWGEAQEDTASMTAHRDGGTASVTDSAHVADSAALTPLTEGASSAAANSHDYD